MTNKKTLIVWVLALVAFTHTSCKKETGSVGSKVSDNSLDLVNIDTFTIITRTVKEDSVRAENFTYQLLGAYNDVEYGKAKAAIISNFTLPSTNFVFPAGVVIDSVVVQLNYLGSSYNGDLSSPVTVQVKQLNEWVSPDSAYYTNRQYQTIGSNTFSSAVKFSPDDSVTVIENGVSKKYAPHLRLKLGNDIVTKFKNASANDLNSNDNFQNYFKGLHISADYSSLATGQGAVAYFDLLHAVSGVAVYFNDTGKYLFPIGKESARISQYEHDYSGAPAVLNQINSPGQDFQQTYVQSMSGLKTQIEVPGLLNLLSSGTWSIVNARFEFNFDGSHTSAGFPAFSRLSLIKRDSLGRNTILLDQLLETSRYDGNKKSGDYYPFFISREIQDILNSYRLYGNNYNTGFYLIAPSDFPMSASRLKMDMGKGQTRGVKFVVSVLKIK